MQMHKSVLMRGALLFGWAPLLFWISGCSSPHYPDYPHKTLAEYKSYTKHHDLSVAAEALTDPQEIKNYFGSNILEDGILPVHIVVINNSEKDSYILLKENIGLLETANISSEDRLQVGHDAENLRDIGLILISPILYAYGDTQAIGQTENFVLKEFQRESIEPGQRASGFIYFRRPDISINVLTVRVTLLEPLAGQKVAVDLKLQGD